MIEAIIFSIGSIAAMLLVLYIMQLIESAVDFLIKIFRPKRKVRVQKRVIRNQRENHFYNFIIE